MNRWTWIGTSALLLAAVALPRTSLLATRAAAPVAPQAAAPADLVLRGGKIVTVDEARPDEGLARLAGIGHLDPHGLALTVELQPSPRLAV